MSATVDIELCASGQDLRVLRVEPTEQGATDISALNVSIELGAEWQGFGAYILGVKVGDVVKQYDAGGLSVRVDDAEILSSHVIEFALFAQSGAQVLTTRRIALQVRELVFGGAISG